MTFVEALTSGTNVERVADELARRLVAARELGPERAEGAAPERPQHLHEVDRRRWSSAALDAVADLEDVVGPLAGLELHDGVLDALEHEARLAAVGRLGLGQVERELHLAEQVVAALGRVGLLERRLPRRQVDLDARLGRAGGGRRRRDGLACAPAARAPGTNRSRQNAARPGARGKGMTSRMLPMPVA